MTKTKKAAFFKHGSFSGTNDSVLFTLRKHFPDYQFDVFDASGAIYKRGALLNVYGAREYFSDLIFRRKSLKDVMLRTTHVFAMVKEFSKSILQDDDYDFSFATQSLFDFSVPGVPHFVYTDHTHLENLRYPSFDRRKLMSRPWIECERQIYANAQLNFTMSSNITRSIVDDYGCREDGVVCVYVGPNVDVDESFVSSDDRYSSQNILFVGVEWERKGGPVLAEAFSVLLKQFPNARLTVVGCCPDLDLRNCEIVGRIEPDKVKQYYRSATIFCLPTLLEPFGIVFLEAMGYKLPIVATSIGAIPDFVENDHNGYLVKPNDARELADRLARLLSDPELSRKFGERGHRRLVDRYAWDRVGEKLQANIRPLISVA